MSAPRLESRMRQRRVIRGVLCAIALLGCMSVITGLGVADDVGVRKRAGIKFPLWKLLPSTSYATLGSGSGSETQWAAYAYRSRGLKRAGEQPCIAVIGFSREGSFPNDTNCGPVVPSDSRTTEPPRYALYGRSHYDNKKTGVIGETVLAIVLPVDIAKVSVRLEDTENHAHLRRKVATRLLSDAQSTKSHLRPFRYVAFNVAADVCLESLAGFDSGGALQFDMAEKECPVG